MRTTGLVPPSLPTNEITTIISRPMRTEEESLRKLQSLIRALPFPSDSDDEEAGGLHAELAQLDGYVAGCVETVLSGGQVPDHELQPDEDLEQRLKALSESDSPGAADALNYLDYLEELKGALIFARAVVDARADRNAGRRPEKEFLGEVEEAFEELIKSGHLRVAESIYDEQYFGNAIVELEGAKFHVRLVKDRSDISAEITSESPTPRGGNWISLPTMIRAVGVKDDLPDSNSLDSAAALISRYGKEIESGISDKRLRETRAEIQRIQAEAEQSLWRQAAQIQRDAAERRAKAAPEPAARKRQPIWVRVALGIEDED